MEITALKNINSVQDLAINDEAPAFSEPLHVGRPNIGERESFLERVNEIFDNRWFSNNGPMVQQFEEEIAKHLGVKHCIAMCNGTIALEIAIRALGLTGEVIVPSYTFVATAHALQWQEITPVFADIDPVTHSLDPDSVRQMITPRTSGIIGVHIWGQPCNIEGLQAVANEHELQLMFDAAHAFSCSHEGQMIGNFGRCEVFSFHATKFFNSFEGGAIATNDDDVAKQIRLMKNFGFAGYDNVIYSGTNGKMTEICAAMGLTSLESIDDFMEVNKRNYLTYKKGIAEIPGLSLLVNEGEDRRNHQYIVMKVDSKFPLTRDEVIQVLLAENVLARKYFWPGCHNMEPYRSFYPHAGLLLTQTQIISNRVIVMPTGTTMSLDNIKAILTILQLLSQIENTGLVKELLAV